MARPSARTGALENRAGPHVAVAGDVYTLKVSGAETGGRYALFEFFVPPGGGPPRHVHTREDEAFFVTEGELWFEVDGQQFTLGPGGFVNAPRDVPHRFANRGDVPARAVVVASPAGLEDFFWEVGTPWDDPTTAPGQPTPDEIGRLMDAAPRYGLEILAPPP